MSFLTLFAAGRSLIGMGDHNSPYRMRAANLLPKFESAKNPFAPKAPAATQTAELIPAAAIAIAVAEPAPAPAALPARVQPANLETVSLFDHADRLNAVPVFVAEPNGQLEIIPAVSPLVENDPAPLALPQAVEMKPGALAQPEMAVPAPAAPALAAVKSQRLFSRWLKKINPFAWLPERKAGTTKETFKPKQAELCLEKVKVIRNHLNDADLEIIGGKTPEKPFVLGGKLQPLAQAQTKAFNRLSAKFFGAPANPTRTHAQCQITTTIQ